MRHGFPVTPSSKMAFTNFKRGLTPNLPVFEGITSIHRYIMQNWKPKITHKAKTQYLFISAIQIEEGATEARNVCIDIPAT